jgi:superfamily II DNA/RNA helicase
LQEAQDTDRDPKAKDFFQELGDDLRIRASGEGATILFSQLNLSRPLLRAVETMGYVTPTPIQVRRWAAVPATRGSLGDACHGSVVDAVD